MSAHFTPREDARLIIRLRAADTLRLAAQMEAIKEDDEAARLAETAAWLEAAAKALHPDA